MMTDGRLRHSERNNQVAGTCFVFCRNQGEQPEASWIGQYLEPSCEEVCLLFSEGSFEHRGAALFNRLHAYILT